MKIHKHLEKIIKITGFLEHKDVPKELEEVDVLLMPSRFDGWGMALIEALAAGRPVIVSRNVGAGIEVVKEGINGFFVEPGSVESLRLVMEKILLAPEKLFEMSKAARESVRGLDVKVGARRFVEACLELHALRNE